MTTQEKMDEKLSAQVGEPIALYLRRRYEQEQATYRELCAELNINTRTLMRRMKRFGIKSIPPKVSGKRNYEKNKAVYHKNLTELKNNDESRHKSALTKQKRWSHFISQYALEVFMELKIRGINPVPEYAIGRYNIDLAFPSNKLAVEIDSGNWHKSSSKKIDQDQNKTLYIESQGWTVLRVGTPTTYPPVSCSQAVKIISSALKS